MKCKINIWWVRRRSNLINDDTTSCRRSNKQSNDRLLQVISSQVES